MIKPISMDARIVVVWTGDPAIDKTATVTETVPDEDRIKAGEVGATKTVDVNLCSRYKDGAARDPVVRSGSLRMLPGEVATEFVIGVIPADEMNEIADDTNEGLGKPIEAQWRAFCAALRDIRHGPTAERTIDGIRQQVVPKTKVRGVERVDPAWLRETFSGPARSAATFVGAIAWVWNRFGDTDAKNS